MRLVSFILLSCGVFLKFAPPFWLVLCFLCVNGYDFSSAIFVNYLYYLLLYWVALGNLFALSDLFDYYLLSLWVGFSFIFAV